MDLEARAARSLYNAVVLLSLPPALAFERYAYLLVKRLVYSRPEDFLPNLRRDLTNVLSKASAAVSGSSERLPPLKTTLLEKDLQPCRLFENLFS